MTEKTKRIIHARVKKVRDKSVKCSNISIDILLDIDKLEEYATDEIAKNTKDGAELLRSVDKNANEIERLLRNYE